MTVKQLLEQASKIKPYWCDCGLHYLVKALKNFPPEVSFDYDGVKKVDKDAPFDIKEELEDCYYVLD